MHPVALVFYFLSLFVFIIWSKHPWMIAVQTVCMLVIAFYYEPKIQKLMPYIGLMLLAAASNPIFVQRGRTILLQTKYIRVTKEALFYGISYGCLLMNVLLLCSVVNRHLKREHWVYLFGGMFPKIGIVFSMAMSLLPKYKRQAGLMMDAQKNISKDSLFRRSVKTFSMETTWAFETSMDQLDSMNARGYGIGKRTHFHLFRFEKKDLFHGMEIVVLFVVNGYAYLHFYQRFFYYPMIIWRPMQFIDLCFMGTMALQFLLPFFWKGEFHVRD